MKGKLFFVFLLILGTATTSFAITDINSCQDLATSETYKLSSNIRANETPCIRVSADDVTLDCNHKVLDANSSSYILVEVSANSFKMQNCNLKSGKVVINGNNMYIKNTEIKNVEVGISGNGIKIEALNSEESSVLIENSQNINITASYFLSGEDQLVIEDSANVSIKSTDFSKGEKGLSIDDGSRGITIEECEFMECETGAEILSGATIRKNTFEKNKRGLVVKDKCSVYGNELVENTEYALVVNGEDNTIYDNKFERNNKDADVSDANNDFNINKNCNQTNIIGGQCQGGNYWDKYTGYDSNGDGFGEEPHQVDSGVYDNLPLTSFVDQRDPIVYLDEPIEGQVLNSRTVVVKYRAFDDVAVAQCWAIVDGVKEQIAGCKKQYELKDVSDGEHTLAVKVADFAGKSDEKSVRFRVDATKPTLEIDAPEEGKEYTGEVQVYFMASDLSEIECFYKIDSGEEKKITGCDDFKLTNLTSGQHKITIRVVDEAGNNETESRNFKFIPSAPEMSVEYSMQCPGNELKIEVYANGQKLSGVSVELKKRIQPGQFSSIGRKQYNGLPISFTILESGGYVISASKEGYEEYEELVTLEKCAVESGGPTQYIAPPEEEEQKSKSCLGAIALFSLLGIMLIIR
ncbi:MAG: NosD domain-containing protein [Candidatus Anstonellales archaeon]